MVDRARSSMGGKGRRSFSEIRTVVLYQYYSSLRYLKDVISWQHASIVFLHRILAFLKSRMKFETAPTWNKYFAWYISFEKYLFFFLFLFILRKLFRVFIKLLSCIVFFFFLSKKSWWYRSLKFNISRNCFQEQN